MTLVWSMSVDGMGPWLVVEGATNREVFETYVEQILVPTLRPAQVGVTDNLTAYKGERIRELIEQRSCELLYLPPYSCEFNPTEEAFAKIKALVRNAEARTEQALVEAIGRGSPWSQLRTLVLSSTTVGTPHRFNHYDE